MTKKILPRVPYPNVLAGLAGSFLIVLPGQAQDTNEPTVMKPTVVTGSYIPTAETVGPAPVQTLSSTAIDAGGQADALLTLKKLVPSFTGGGNYLGSVNNNVNIGAGFQAFTGESYAQIRNLPTLILIDGQRVVSSGLSGGQAVDLNTIPLAMIERVEVLKDGASAIYGSDAIGGVINIITKKNFNGFELGGRYGFPTDGPGDHGVQYDVHFVAGASTENTRFTAGGQIYEQNPLDAKDRTIGSQSIASLAGQNMVPPAYISPSYPGKVQAGGSSWILAGSPFAIGAAGYNPGLTTPPVFAGHSFSGNTAVIDYNAYAIAHGYVDPTGHGLGPYIPFASTPVGQGLNAIGVGEASAWPALNTTDFGSTSILSQDRRQFWANFEHDLFGDKMTVYSRFLFSDNSAEGQLAPAPVPFPSLYNIAIPANNPYNPFQVDLGAGGTENPRARMRFVDFGNRTYITFSDFYQWVGGLKGNITPDYTYDVSFNYGRNRQEQQTRNEVNGLALNQALIPNGSVDAQGRPLSTLVDANGNNVPVYNFFAAGLAPGSSGNAIQTIDALRATQFQWAQTELYSGQGVFNARPIELPAGKVNIAFGAQYIAEQLSLQQDGLSALNFIPGGNPLTTLDHGVRETTAGFIEVSIPILGKDQGIPGFYDLELDVAGRYQVFEPGGDDAVPKVGVLWKPLDDQITLRGSYGQGFVAPPIFQLFGPGFVSNPNVTINGAPGQVNVTTLSNPNLQASHSEQFGAGIVLSPKPVPGLNLSADYYYVTYDNVPIADAQGAANSLNALGPNSPFYSGFSTVDGTPLTGPNQVTIDNWANLNMPWAPAGRVRTQGIDLAGDYKLPLPEEYGKVDLNAVANVLMDYEQSTGTGRPFFDYAGTYTPYGLFPDWNLTATLTYQYQNWTASASVHYLPPTSDPGGLFPDYNLGIQGFTINNPTQPYNIPAYYTIDLQLSYEFGKHKIEGRKWYDGTRLTVGVLNVTDEPPPLIVDAVEDNTDKNNYDVLGRFLYFEVSKKF
jgi:iron complex outermembrane recepter protein